MNLEVKEKWLKALRSGEYEQGKGRLKDENKYCCLGVLCDLYIKENQNYKWDDGGLINIDDGTKYISYQPQEVDIWAGVDLLKVIGPEKVGLPTHNDGRYSQAFSTVVPKTFLEIADIIEKEL